MLFSQRKGLKPIKSIIQVESMDDELRNSLWNALSVAYLQGKSLKSSLGRYPNFNLLSARLWDQYFKKPVDERQTYWGGFVKEIRDYIFSCEWYEVYDFVEFFANTYPDDKENTEFLGVCNHVLERELSAYRFVGGLITQITSEAEIGAIEEALSGTRNVAPVHEHLRKALDYLSDRKSPDYRNSIKESISAVESVCNLITGGKATLGQAIKQLETKVEVHPALKNAFSSIYGYTSDASGIRHALLDESNLDFEDAKFMLVSCSAFTNYLIAKSTKAGITL